VIDPTTFLPTSDFPHIFPCFTPLIRFRRLLHLSNEAAILTLNAVPVCSHPLHSKITCWTVALSLPQHGHWNCPMESYFSVSPPLLFCMQGYLTSHLRTSSRLKANLLPSSNSTHNSLVGTASFLAPFPLPPCIVAGKQQVSVVDISPIQGGRLAPKPLHQAVVALCADYPPLQQCNEHFASAQFLTCCTGICICCGGCHREAHRIYSIFRLDYSFARWKLAIIQRCHAPPSNSVLTCTTELCSRCIHPLPQNASRPCVWWVRGPAVAQLKNITYPGLEPHGVLAVASCCAMGAPTACRVESAGAACRYVPPAATGVAAQLGTLVLL
jgi:hypothetical protein